VTRTRSRLSPLILIGLLVSLLPLGVLPAAATTGDLVITGVIDGPLTGGLPKAVELYVANDIPDLSIYAVGSANNGGGTDGEEFTLPAASAVAGEFIYLATEATGFTDFFGFAPDYVDGDATLINGDDAIELFMNGVVVDVFGEIDLSGTGQPWDYLDGWAYRLSGAGQDGATFAPGNLFDGQLGYLDYALANQALAGQVTGATAWHINADEPDIIDYDTTFKMDAQDALYAPDPYRSSDHDAVIVGLRLDQKPPKVKADLDRIFTHHDQGWFRVDFSCKDEVDRRPECVADLNGIPVQDGQKVYLIRSPGAPWTFGSGRVLIIKDESFLLTVTGTDDSGNSATDSDEPRFRQRGHHWT